jgi:hypothetical protein
MELKIQIMKTLINKLSRNCGRNGINIKINNHSCNFKYILLKNQCLHLLKSRIYKEHEANTFLENQILIQFVKANYANKTLLKDLIKEIKRDQFHNGNKCMNSS